MELKAENREKFGRKTVALRKAGFLPAELYGRGRENLHLSLQMKDFKKVYKAAGENTIVNVEVATQKIPALIYDVAFDYLSDEPAHVDLYAVRMDEKLQTKVPLEFVGESPAVKSLGGVLVKAVKEVLVEALPEHLPHSFVVDVSKLTEIGMSIHLADLSIPKEVKVLVDLKTVVATIKAKMTEEEEAALAGPASVETIKVETEEKKADRDAKKTAEAPAGEGATAPKAETTKK